MQERMIAYYRVSTQKQGISGLGLDAQRTDIYRHINATGGELVAEFVEIESGRITDRPILTEALAACKKQKAKLVIAKLDRLARNVAFVSNILDSKISFVACDAPHADRTFLQMLSVFAEHEARMISQRTKSALAAAKARGVRLGSHGKVLAEQNRIAAHEFAQTVQTMIEDGRQRGCTTLAQLASHMNSARVLTRQGAKWTPTGVQRVLRRLDLPTPAMERRLAA